MPQKLNTRDTQILDFYRDLQSPAKGLPEDIAVMNPYQQGDAEVWRLLKFFYEKFYKDTRPRGLILGINPGRLGAGITGIPFTDAPALRQHCGIETSLETREVSATFIYQVIEAYGGARAFYQDWFIGAVCPLGFVRRKAENRWVNYNYYDRAALEERLRPFIAEQLLRQREICGHPSRAIVLGSGKNYQYLQKRNQQEGWFDQVIPLEHPRYIMQYRRKQMNEYLEKFVETLQSCAPPRKP